MKFISNILYITLLLFVMQACGGESAEHSSGSDSNQEQGLTAFELEHGIGPITERIEVDDELDEEMIIRGRNIYEMKCEMCHNMEGRMVGPALGDVMENRTPEFVMNMILNPGGMARNHPEGQKMLQEYMTVMPFQNVKEDEARDIVEFLRKQAENN